MENKNTLLLTIIAVATLMVAVVGATFAYFQASITGADTPLVNVTTNTPAVPTFTCVTGSAITLAPTGADMLVGAANNTTAKKTANSTMNCTLTGGTGASCSYDIKFVNTGTAYTKTTNATKEMTLAGSTSSSGAGGNKTLAEINWDAAANKTVLTGATITIASGSSATVSWTFTGKFYNLNLNQTALAGKTYAGNFQVTNVQC